MLTSGAGSTQGDGITLIQANQAGIVDFNNQSRVRAFLEPVSDPPHAPQVILPGTWFPIEFDNDSMPRWGYDQHNEFTPWTPAGNPGYFTARVDGFHQVHARTEFLLEGQPVPGGYVSIAIFVQTPGGPPSTIYAQGNNLQVVFIGPAGGPEWLPGNNAPNVSDVVWLKAGDVVTIHVYQTTGVPLTLVPGHEKTYVSIHKDS
jgi:hypothetical protein